MTLPSPPQDPSIRTLTLFCPAYPRYVGMPRRVRLNQDATVLIQSLVNAAIRLGMAWRVDEEGNDEPTV
jgi:hypothetical protein